ncbi:hypothetical protein QJQ45_002826 [Haematococcus lacustris]|nr:hypothetical protein QJQ45_002826 [Haematococcus lacustris]
MGRHSLPGPSWLRDHNGDSEDSEDEYQRRRRRRLEDEDADADAAFLILQQGGEARAIGTSVLDLTIGTVLKARTDAGQWLCDDIHYVSAFRMGRATFNWLKAQLRPRIKTQRLTAGQRLALALRYLASGATMQVVADDMGRGHATVHDAVHVVCSAIMSQLGGMISMPTTVAQLTVSAAKFMMAGQGVPQCCFAVDGTHIAHRDFGVPAMHNRKHFTSINVQALCDGDGLWVAVEVGNAGSMHDARAFAESEYVNVVIMACFLLHNIVELRAEPAPNEEDDEYLALKRAYDAMFEGGGGGGEEEGGGEEGDDGLGPARHANAGPGPGSIHPPSPHCM